MRALTCFCLTLSLVQDQTTFGAHEWFILAMLGYNPAILSDSHTAIKVHLKTCLIRGLI